MRTLARRSTYRTFLEIWVPFPVGIVLLGRILVKSIRLHRAVVEVVDEPHVVTIDLLVQDENIAEADVSVQEPSLFPSLMVTYGRTRQSTDESHTTRQATHL